jgi:hypothetical protein
MRKEFANSMRATHIRQAGAHEAEYIEISGRFRLAPEWLPAVPATPQKGGPGLGRTHAGTGAASRRKTRASS